jgi:hypothetical protein
MILRIRPMTLTKATGVAAIPTLLLCLMASLQIYLVRSSQLSPWKGGGFGMFSTVDSAEARFLKIFVATPEEQLAVVPPDGLHEEVLRARCFPTVPNLEKIAKQLVAASWVEERLVSPAGRGTIVSIRPLARGEKSRPTLRMLSVNSVKVELWRSEFVASDTTLKAWSSAEVIAHHGAREGSFVR